MAEIKKVAVILPFYKPELSAHETIALEQAHKIFAKHPIIAVKPEGLVLPDTIAKYPFADVKSFNDEYFKSVKGYNRLMLAAGFYNAFRGYEFILIHQLDAFAFRDELLAWCRDDIDYIGAPWIRVRDKMDRWNIIKSRLQYFIYSHNKLQKPGIDNHDQLENQVGNGGFSLRRVKKFADICEEMPDEIQVYNEDSSNLFNEDVFWSVEPNRGKKRLNIPGYKEALKFAFEIAPERARNMNNGNLPFGCHAWDLNLDFWRPVFKEYGYAI